MSRLQHLINPNGNPTKADRRKARLARNLEHAQAHAALLAQRTRFRQEQSDNDANPSPAPSTNPDAKRAKLAIPDKLDHLPGGAAAAHEPERAVRGQSKKKTPRSKPGQVEPQEVAADEA